ncbi:MAG: asparagine synthase-related protein [Pseudomonadota bacterium]
MSRLFARVAADGAVEAIDAPSSAVDEAGQRHALVAGQPAWTDSELARLASDRGPAHALLAAHERFGDRALDHMRGAFAVALVDGKNRSGMLAIDRMGRCALCYTVTGTGELAFGTDADAVAIHATGGRRLDVQMLFSYLFFHVIPGPESAYQGVSKLGPGQRLTWQGASHKVDYHWLPAFDDSGPADMDALAEELRQTLADAVARCNPDGTTGAFLSGGLDSSTVAGMAARSDSDVVAYSIGFSAEGYDEMEYARLAARHFKLPLKEYYVTPEDIVETIPKIADSYPEPFGNSSAVPAFVCARFAREDGKTAMLAGDGGDELFAGNERYAKQELFQYYDRLPGWLRRAVMEPLLLGLPLTKWTPPTRKLRSYIEQARVSMPSRLQTYNFVEREGPGQIFSDAFLAKVEPQAAHANMQERYDAAPTANMLHQMLFLDWKLTLADNDLPKVSRMCELAGIDVHYPMLDDALVELSTRVPPKMKLKGSDLRHFYKFALKDFLPHETITKEKHGFGLPFGVWLKTHKGLGELVYGSLENLKSRGIFRDAFIDELVATHRGGHAAYYGGMLWVMMMLEQWLQAHAPELRG